MFLILKHTFNVKQWKEILLGVAFGEGQTFIGFVNFDLSSIIEFNYFDTDKQIYKFPLSKNN